MHESGKQSILFYILLSGTLLYSSFSSAQEPTGFELEIKPRVCVRLELEEPCGMELDIVWSATASADVCLRASVEDVALRCWEESRRGNLILRYASDENYYFLLQDTDSATVVATADITVVTRDLRNLRRRRRHVWSIL